MTDPVLQKFAPRPGINREVSRLSGEGGWYDADKVRFRYGKPEKIGGWQNVNGIPDTDQFDGICRALWNWRDLSGFPWTAIGTTRRLQLWRGGTYYDITPVRATVSTSAEYRTSTNSLVVRVSMPSHGATDTDYFWINSTVSVGGLNLFGEYIVSVCSTDVFTFRASSSATSDAATTAAVSTHFLLPIGDDSQIFDVGWGAGVWGHAGGWGRPPPSQIVKKLRTWSLDNWGEDLVANPRTARIYHWGNDVSVNQRASAIPGSPTEVDFILVSPEDRHLIAFGTLDVSSSSYDPLYLRWCDQENFSDWVASADNTAGEKRLSSGNRIVAAKRSRGQILVFTEDSLFGMQFIGPPFTFGFQVLGESAGVLGPNAVVEVAGRTFWMADQKFMVYDGGAPRPIKCDVLRFIFDNLNTSQLDKIFAASNQEFNEVWWFYQDRSETATDINRYVIYNYVEDHWSVGALTRTAWSDRSVYGQPVAAGWNGQAKVSAHGKLYFHEVEHDDDGENMPSYLESNDFDIGDGDDLQFVDRVIPDFTHRSGDPIEGNVFITIKTRNYNTDEGYKIKGPYTVSVNTRFVSTRIRGRQAVVRVDSSGSGLSWRLGTLRLRTIPDGKR